MKEIVCALVLALLFLVAPSYSAGPVITNEDLEKYNNPSSQKNNSSKKDELGNSKSTTMQRTGSDEKSAQPQDSLDDSKKREIERLATQVWSSMTNKLRSGDIEGALEYFTDNSRDQYRRIFQKMGNKTDHITSLIEIKFNTVYGPIVECWASRQEKEGNFAYPVTFVKYDSGELKIFGF